MTEASIIIEKPEDGITELILNRPDKRNALSIAMMKEICQAVDEANNDSTMRVIILRGAGPVFCAGLDLQEAADSKKAHESAQCVAQVLETVHTSPLVTIAAVKGAAIAGGAGLMTACDLAVASEGSRFGYPETRRGLVAALVMSFLVRQVGDRAARELLLIADLIDSEDAKAISLINHVVPTGDLRNHAIYMAKQVIKGAPHATACTKRLLSALSPHSIQEDLSRALEHHVEIRNSDEAQEGIRAWNEKREPDWTSGLKKEKV